MYAGEYRNFFEFEIPAISGSIVSASLVLHSFNIGLEQTSQSVTYQVTSLGSGFGYSDLGSGQFYGSRDYTTADFWAVNSIDLSASAIQDILAAQGGTFRLSGRLSAGGLFGPEENDQYLFGAGTALQQLVLVTSGEPGPAEIPEPSVVVLVASGFLLVAARFRSR